MTLISRLNFSIDKKEKKMISDKIEIKEISIVIPVKDNQNGIDNYLNTFFKIHNNNELPKEIIIVDNNSRPALKIRNEYLNKRIPVKLFKCSKIGPASARNLGSRSSTGKWLLFNDSDCIPTNSILKGYTLNDNLSIAYAGNVKALKNNSLSKYYDSQEILIPLKTKNTKGKFVPQYLITANTLVWKKAFEKIEGFNENIKIAGGEDVDLGLRLSEIGDLSFAFDSIAIHDFPNNLKDFYSRFKRYGVGNRIVEEIWNTSLKPYKFKPNVITITNRFYAYLQFKALKNGYEKQDKIFKSKK